MPELRVSARRDPAQSPPSQTLQTGNFLSILRKQDSVITSCNYALDMIFNCRYDFKGAIRLHQSSFAQEHPVLGDLDLFVVRRCD